MSAHQARKLLDFTQRPDAKVDLAGSHGRQLVSAPLYARLSYWRSRWITSASCTHGNDFGLNDAQFHRQGDLAHSSLSAADMR